MNIQIVNKSNNPLPKYETQGASGMDVRANLRYSNYEKIQNFLFNCDIYKADEEEIGIDINPGGRCLIPTGLFVSIPIGYEIQVRPRSGLALKKGITVLNTPGTIDADYRGEVGVILINLSSEPFVIEPGERICQMVFAKYEKAIFDNVDFVSDTARGAGGFGHTGVK